MLAFADLPRDHDGVIQGRYRVRVKDSPRPDLETRPVVGFELVRLHAAVGPDRMTIEPWDAAGPKKRRGRSR